MSKFNKIIILNKTFPTQTDKQSNKKAKIVKISKQKISPTTLSTSFLLISSTKLNTTRLTLKVLPIQQRLHQPPSNLTVRENIKDVLSRSVNLFLINHYFKPEYKHLDKEDLLKIAETIRIDVTLEDCRFIEVITRDHKSWYWQKLRAGRVTSSRFKSVCGSAHFDHPDINLLTEICYPEKCVNAATGPTNEGDERVAMSQFIVQMKKIHTNFNCKKIGLIVNRNYPHFASTPDGRCSCECCGTYFVKIVCPFGSERRNVSIKHLLEMKDSFMVVKNGAHCLQQDHQYFYQLQMQMALGGSKFTYFYVWSTGFRITNKIFFDPLFWAEKSERAMIFAKKVLSVELMCSYYTNIY